MIATSNKLLGLVIQWPASKKWDMRDAIIFEAGPL
jgi:hypothetical protein